eukprot:gene26901-35597_t
MGVNLTRKFPLHSAVGSVQRAKEFINMLVAAEGSVEAMALHVNISEGRRLFESAELMHVSPMIGTLLMAQDFEHKPLRLYRFEDLDAEWKRLESDSRLVGLYKAKKATAPRHHKSALKPFGNKARRAMQSVFSDTRHGTEGYFYIRIVCRLYLMDFYCMNYRVPSSCQDIIEEELPALIEKFKE